MRSSLSLVKMLALSLPLSLAAQATDGGSASSASSASGSPFSQGEKVVYAGLGLGGLNGVYGSVSVPPITLGMDYAFEKNISAGGLVGFSQSN